MVSLKAIEHCDVVKGLIANKGRSGVVIREQGTVAVHKTGR